MRGVKDGILERAGWFFVVSFLLFFLFSPLFRLSVTTSTRVSCFSDNRGARNSTSISIEYREGGGPIIRLHNVTLVSRH